MVNATETTTHGHDDVTSSLGDSRSSAERLSVAPGLGVGVRGVDWVAGGVALDRGPQKRGLDENFMISRLEDAEELHKLRDIVRNWR